MARDVLARQCMFGRLTKLFKRSAAKPQDYPPALPASARTAPAAASAPGTAATATSAPEVAAAPQPTTSSSAASGDSVTLPFSSILQLVPKELHGRITAAGLTGFNFSIAKEKILPQLAQGTVKVNFGELRHAAPAGAFVSSSSHDGKMIDLPLGEILGQLGAEAFARK